MYTFLSLVTWPNVLACCTMLSLNAYVVLGGADFGGGVWDLLASGPRRQAQRDLIAHAIGPIWEANHVWLILVVVLLFTCFPPAFAVLMTFLHIPLTIMLIGIVLRGSAFTFRAYDVSLGARPRRWGELFAAASVVTPFVLGVCVGTIASGALGTQAIPSDASVYSTYVAPWLEPFPLSCGLFALVVFAFLAAVYLTVDATTDVLREDFRRRAVLAAVAVCLVAFGTLTLSLATPSPLRQSLTATVWAFPFHVATGAAALLTIWALWTRRYQLARIAAPAQVSLILWGWGVSQYPDLIPGRLSITDAAAPPVTLRLTLTALSAGAVVLIPSLWCLFRVFKGRQAD